MVVFTQRLFPKKVLFSVKLFVTNGFLINISTLLSTNHKPRKTDYGNIEDRQDTAGHDQIALDHAFDLSTKEKN